MGSFKTGPRDRFRARAGDDEYAALRQKAIDRFDPGILGLGDLKSHSRDREVVCAIFDLGGFTDFCRQVDPHLAVPEFMSHFLDWLFGEVKQQSIWEVTDGGAILWTQLPFFAKFMGDGVLFLWDVGQIGDHVGVFNIALRTAEICDAYESRFLLVIGPRVVNPPARLRCGVARGKVYSVGNGRGRDYVGPCINIAARLQKLVPGITHCFSRRGFDADQSAAPEIADTLVVRRVAVRGIGDSELVYVRRREFDLLSEIDRASLMAP